PREPDREEEGPQGQQLRPARGAPSEPGGQGTEGEGGEDQESHRGVRLGSGGLRALPADSGLGGAGPRVRLGGSREPRAMGRNPVVGRPVVEEPARGGPGAGSGRLGQRGEGGTSRSTDAAQRATGRL